MAAGITGRSAQPAERGSLPTPVALSAVHVMQLAAGAHPMRESSRTAESAVSREVRRESRGE